MKNDVTYDIYFDIRDENIVVTSLENMSGVSELRWTCLQVILAKIMCACIYVSNSRPPNNTSCTSSNMSFYVLCVHITAINVSKQKKHISI